MAASRGLAASALASVSSSRCSFGIDTGTSCMARAIGAAAVVIASGGAAVLTCQEEVERPSVEAERIAVRDAITKSNLAPVQAWVRQYGIDAAITRAGQSALSVAAEHGSMFVAQALIASSADLGSCDGQDLSTLMYAARMGHARVVQLLIENRAMPDKPTDLFGNAPLHMAVGFGHVEATRALLTARSDPNLQQGEIRAPASYGAVTLHETPLHLACRPKPPQIEVKRLALVLLLLSFGANPCTQDDRGDTPVHILARQGDAPTLWSLLSRAPADLAHMAAHVLPNSHGATALDEAANLAISVRMALHCGPHLAKVRERLGIRVKVEETEHHGVDADVEEEAWKVYRARLADGSSLLPFEQGGDGIRRRSE